MIGHRTPHYRAFGWAAARLDDVLNIVPAPLSGAAVWPRRRCSPRTAGRAARSAIMLRDGRKHHSPNAGWPESGDGRGARSGAGRAAPLPGGLVADPWLGDGTRARGDRPTSRGHCSSTASPACSMAGSLLGAWLAAHVTLLG